MKPATTNGAADVLGLIVRHDPWCGMAHGEGSSCAPGCNPTTELVDPDTLAATMTRDFRNRAQRRAAARAARREKP